MNAKLPSSLSVNYGALRTGDGDLGIDTEPALLTRCA